MVRLSMQVNKMCNTITNLTTIITHVVPKKEMALKPKTFDCLIISSMCIGKPPFKKEHKK